MYESWLQFWVPRNLGNVFLDVGANEGLWSQILVPRFTRGYAIEVNPDLIVKLRETLPANVEVINTGIWSQPGTVTFSQYAHTVHLSASYREGTLDSGPPVGTLVAECTTLDLLPIVGKVDFVKIDVEGAECEVLAGARRILTEDRPRWLIEVHSTAAFVSLCRTFLDAKYVLDTVRHPGYIPFGRKWFQHCWLVAQPRPEGIP